MNKMCIIIALNVLCEHTKTLIDVSGWQIGWFIEKHFVNNTFKIMNIMSWGNLGRVL